MYCRIMRNIFEKEHVKEWSLILMRAYGYRPTTLSLWSSDLWMKCAQWKCGGSITHRSQDHFIFVALDGKRGGEMDEVVDGVIYYYATFFLTWIPKHEKKDLLVAPSSFLLMGA